MAGSDCSNSVWFRQNLVWKQINKWKSGVKDTPEHFQKKSSMSSKSRIVFYFLTHSFHPDIPSVAMINNFLTLLPDDTQERMMTGRMGRISSATTDCRTERTQH